MNIIMPSSCIKESLETQDQAEPRNHHQPSAFKHVREISDPMAVYCLVIELLYEPRTSGF